MVAPLFIIYLVVELAAFVWVATAIGLGWTLLLLIAFLAIGAWVLKTQTLRIIRQLHEGSNGGASATATLADSAIVAAGAALLVLPGLVTGVAGLFLLLPRVRALVRPTVKLSAARRLTQLASIYADGFVAAARQSTWQAGAVIDTARMIDTATVIDTAVMIDGEVRHRSDQIADTRIADTNYTSDGYQARNPGRDRDNGGYPPKRRLAG